MQQLGASGSGLINYHEIASLIVLIVVSIIISVE